MVLTDDLMRIALAGLVATAIVLVGFLLVTGVPRLAKVTSVPSDPADATPMDPGALLGGLLDGQGGESSIYDEMVRIASWAFILSTAAIVGWSGLWPDSSPQIFLLLVVAGLFVVLVHDLVPASVLGAARYALEGVAAIAVGGILLYLTGGQASPFFFTFPLIVGTASLVVRPRATFFLAVAGVITYVVAAYYGREAASMAEVAASAVNITALVLLGYAGSVIGREQRRSRDAAIRFSAADPLTGLFNRTLFFAALERELARSARSGRGFCLLMMDLDELKAINDRGGHHAGDVALQAIADRILAGVRKIDVAARYGGDEFVALLPETDPTGGWILAEKLRLSIASLQLPGMISSPTVSIGVVSFPRDGDTVDALMIKADQAMYVSKRTGRNRVAGPLSGLVDGGDPMFDLSAPSGMSGLPV